MFLKKRGQVINNCLLTKCSINSTFEDNLEMIKKMNASVLYLFSILRLKSLLKKDSIINNGFPLVKI